jgi:apolipoprotein N-acyltransferase
MINFKKKHLLYLSLLSGFLLSFAWPVDGFLPIIFIALTPLLLIEDYVSQHKKQFNKFSIVNYSFLTFFTWNILTTWWIYNSSLGGAAMAIIANSILMSCVFSFGHWIKNRLPKKLAYTALVSIWLTFEFIHLDWDITWPWLTLGNVFSNTTSIIQWYEYTGVFGGSIWVWVLNILIYVVFRNVYLEGKDLLENKKKLMSIVLLIVLPVAISFYIQFNYQEKVKPVNVVILQPNIDPYTEKFNGLTQQEQLDKMLVLAEKQIDDNTDYLIAPETALPNNIDERDLAASESIQRIKNFIAPYPKLKALMGISSYKFYATWETPSLTARAAEDGSKFDYYNTAMQLDNKGKIQLYHKSKLVPGVEKMPFPFIFKHIEEFAINLGGTAGSLGMQDTRDVFVSSNDDLKIAPIICYESIYGEYVGDYVKNGANILTIITNDGWWGNTPGYHQHLSYARLRAIEHRRSIARSANTGTSAIINQLGEVQQPTEWWKPAVIKGSINKNDDLTFYTRYGDYIARIALVVALVCMVLSFIYKSKVVSLE